ncbi:MAG: hypothetical protein ACM3IJ_05535 [Candidatus Levyibacteriota bacterium]
MKKKLLLLSFGITLGFVIFLLFFPILRKTGKHFAIRMKNETCTAFSILSPSKNTPFISPGKIVVEVDNTNPGCLWTVFEGQAGTITLSDKNGTVLAREVLKTEEDWMQQKKVRYTATLSFKKPGTESGIIKFTEENPSGKPDPDQVLLPVSF